LSILVTFVGCSFITFLCVFRNDKELARFLSPKPTEQVAALHAFIGVSSRPEQGIVFQFLQNERILTDDQLSEVKVFFYIV